MPSTATTVIVEALPDLLIDLHDLYGASFPRPIGSWVQFTVVDDNTTYQKAERQISGLLARHGLLPGNVTITPGPEDKRATNRKIVIQVAKNLLM
jgi:hypothetical protein